MIINSLGVFFRILDEIYIIIWHRKIERLDKQKND